MELAIRAEIKDLERRLRALKCCCEENLTPICNQMQDLDDLGSYDSGSDKFPIVRVGEGVTCGLVSLTGDDPSFCDILTTQVYDDLGAGADNTTQYIYSAKSQQGDPYSCQLITLPATGFTYGLNTISTTPYDLEDITGEWVLFVDATVGNITINLPTAVGNASKFTFKKIDATVNTVILDGDLAETIDGAATKVITVQWKAITVASDGTNWFIINSF